MRDKILEKLRKGYTYVTINPNRDELFCPICRKSLGLDENVFVVQWYCLNQKCKAYLLRSPSYTRGFLGGVSFSKDDIKKYLSEKVEK